MPKLTVEMAANIAQLRRDMNSAVSTVDKGFKDIRGAANAVRNIFGAIGIGLGVGAIIKEFKDVIAAAVEAEKTEARLAAVINATGQAAGITKAELIDLAKATQTTTGINQEAVKSAEAILLSFPRIGREAFGPALKLSTDLAAVLGTDLSSAASNVGRALQDPVQGLTALSRIGIRFTATQRELITSLVNSGQAAKAQEIIMGELERRIGGAGAGQNVGLVKATSDLKNKWDDLLESFGRTKSVTGVTRTILDFLSGAVEGASQLIDPSEDLQLGKLAKRRQELEKIVADNEKSISPFTKQRLASEREELRVINDQIEAIFARNRARNKEFDDTTTKGKAAQVAQAQADRTEAARAFLEHNDALIAFNKEVKNIESLQLTEEQRINAIADAFGKYGQATDRAEDFNQGLTQSFINTNRQIDQQVTDLQNATRQSNAALISNDRERALQLLAIDADVFKQRLDLAEISGSDRARIEKAYADFYIAEQARIREATKSVTRQVLDAWRDTDKQLDNAWAGWLQSGADALAEWAITGQNTARQFVEGVLRDLARIQIQKALLGIFGGASSLFTPATSSVVTPRQSGGPVLPGRGYIVGESGPELFVPKQSGTIMPNVSNSSKVNLNQTFNFGSGVSRAELVAMIPVIREQTKAAVADAAQRDPRYRAAFT